MRYGDYTVTGSAYSSVFVWLTSQAVPCASSARVLYLSIYAGLPVSGETNKNQNYAYITLLFRRLLEASVNTEHVFTWLNTNGHTCDSAPCSCISSTTTTIYKTA